jgi:hypothetical protein
MTCIAMEYYEACSCSMQAEPTAALPAGGNNRAPSTAAVAASSAPPSISVPDSSREISAAMASQIEAPAQ